MRRRYAARCAAVRLSSSRCSGIASDILLVQLEMALGPDAGEETKKIWTKLVQVHRTL